MLRALRAAALLSAGVLHVLGLTGCQRESEPNAVPAKTPAPPAVLVSAPAPKPKAPDAREYWDIYLIKGQRVGSGVTRVTDDERNGQKLWRIEATQQYTIRRFDQSLTQEMSFTSLETPAGQLLQFESTIKQGQMPVITTGMVNGNRLQMQVITAGKTMPLEIPWSKTYGGFYRIDGSLQQQPMQPGETRRLDALVPGANSVATVEMKAADYEPVALPSGTQKLLRIDAKISFPGGSLSHVAWCNAQGEVLRDKMLDTLELETIRTTKEEATRKVEPSRLDLGTDIAVKLAKPLPRGHNTEKVRYRVTLEGRDPSTVFPESATQHVRRESDNTAEITVWALRPDRKGNTAAPDDAPTKEDRGPTNFVQSDDPLVVAAAKEAADDEADAWQTAVKLERYVRRTMRHTGLTAAFASAAEVAKNPTGDCTEHGVFLAALARARGLPARMAFGLVYVERHTAFEYHMWTEIFVDGRWIPLDGTLGRGGIGAAHLKVGHSSGTSDLYLAMLPVLQIADKLKIEVLDVQWVARKDSRKGAKAQKVVG